MLSNSCYVTILANRGARVKNSLFKDATVKEGGAIAEDIVICM